MSDIVLKASNVAKKYDLGLTGNLDLRSAISNGMSRFWSKRARTERQEQSIFWALQDISFEVRRGETIGIIGNNGAGKSTLLKIFSQITPPSKGRIEIDGRVASLLEVGTGFHPELTGRENIFLNGSILGMSREEIKRKFDEIVEFSGVAQFLETPIKRYSSGMAVRLAFSVAAHLEPEILLVDEVLSVGDLAFQKKCLRKMDEVTASGRTILFVSHNMRTIKQLCSRGILLEKGKMLIDDEMDKVIQLYMQQSAEVWTSTVSFKANSQKVANIIEVSLQNGKKELTNQFQFGEPFLVGMKIKVNRDAQFSAVIGIETADGIRVATAKGMDADFSITITAGDIVPINAAFDSLYLTPGKYRILLRIVEGKGHVLDQQAHAIAFEVLEMNYKNTVPFSGGMGIIRCIPNWSTSPI